MTVQLITKTNRYMGLSTDTKPTDCPVGSRFYELNTGQHSIWDGEVWNEDISLINALVIAAGE